jgi:hypothetical protein
MNILWNGVDGLRLGMGLGNANHIGEYTSSCTALCTLKLQAGFNGYSVKISSILTQET